jgi:hypothetical protein
MPSKIGNALPVRDGISGKKKPAAWQRQAF